MLISYFIRYGESESKKRSQTHCQRALFELKPKNALPNRHDASLVLFDHEVFNFLSL